MTEKKTLLDHPALARLTDAQVLALTIYGEARGEGVEGMLAVGSVVLSRVRRRKWYGHTVKEVCLHPWQFSCWNEGDPNRGVLLGFAEKIHDSTFVADALRQAMEIARGLVGGTIHPSVDATHYHTVGCDPKWDNEMQLVATIGKHEFYEEV